VVTVSPVIRVTVRTAPGRAPAVSTAFVAPDVVADALANDGGMTVRIARADPRAISLDLRGYGVDKENSCHEEGTKHQKKRQKAFQRLPL
jgi:hypothetical protein